MELLQFDQQRPARRQDCVAAHTTLAQDFNGLKQNHFRPAQAGGMRNEADVHKILVQCAVRAVLVMAGRDRG